MALTFNKLVEMVSDDLELIDRIRQQMPEDELPEQLVNLFHNAIEELLHAVLVLRDEKVDR